MNTIKLISMIPLYKLNRSFGFPKIMPSNLTVSVTYKCNSRCSTCNVWKKNTEEFTLEEFEKTFKSIGDVFWITFSGGEPFLRNDFVEICKSAYGNCRPKIINIPTNGLLFDKIPESVEEIVKSCPKTQIVVNLSIDGIGERHDIIRGVKGNFNKAMKTYEALRSLNYKNFNLGVHTVISKFNVENIPEIYELAKKLRADSFITEIAEERVELDTMGADITPSIEDYSTAIDFLSERIRKYKFSGLSKITQAFRLQYYDLVKRTLRERRQVIPCYAGIASCQISPDGDVWACCIKAKSMGNLRDVDYDFKKIWFSEKANEIRKSIKNKECYCPLANASYTNMLCNFKTLGKVLWIVLFK